MGKTPRSNETYGVTRWRKEVERHNATKATLHDKETALKEAQDIIAVLTQENLELTKQVKDYRARFEKGGIAYTVNDGYVSNVVRIPPYSEWTYNQDVPSGIGTTLYKTFPYVKVDDRAFLVDERQYKKYLGGVL